MYLFDCKTEHRKNPVGLDSIHPRFSWKIKSDLSNVRQKSYHILVSRTKDFKTLVWDSKVVESDQSLYILYNGNELQNMTRYYWKVIVCSEEESAESDVNYFEMGVLDSSWWKAKWIEPENEIDYFAKKPAVYLRKIFWVKEGLKKARVYQTAHGNYHFFINGKNGTEDLFNPGFTSYYHRLQYQIYDITDLLLQGENVWGILLGDGWWRGVTGGTVPNNFGYKLAFLGQLQLEYEDGSVELVISDESFKAATGAWITTDMREGEIYDARKERERWNEKEFCDSEWNVVHVAKEANTLDSLIPSRSVPVRKKEKFKGKAFIDKEGNTVIDFGQNIAGIVSMIFRNCRKGEVIRIEYGEDLENGVFSRKNLLSPGATEIGEFQRNIYIAKGKKKERFEPYFGVFGFRYIKIEGYRQEIDPKDFTAIAIYSDLEETGEFSCSNPLLNQLFSNCKWSQKGNYLDVPTDCPTRERSPWTGDSQIYCATSSLLMDVYPFMEKWMADFPYEQYPNGMVPSTVPNTISPHQPEEVKRINESVDRHSFLATLPGHMYTDPEYGAEYSDGSAGWGDAAVINPWTLYVRYGDQRILMNQYESAKKWVEYVRIQAKKHNEVYKDALYNKNETDGILDGDYVWDTGFQYGEWLEPDVNCFADPEFFPNLKKYSNPQTATAYYAYSTGLLSKMASVLGKKEDEKEYSQLSEKIRGIYAKYFIGEDGCVLEGRQAPSLRTLKFELCTEKQKSKVEEYLISLIKKNNEHLNTGFLSTAYLLPVLHEIGQTELAFRLLEQTSFPSWLFNVEKGATTILEDWRGCEIHIGSFNHYSYGAVCEFLIEIICGVKVDSNVPGYKHFFIQPTIGGSLKKASTAFESPYGRIRSQWKKKNEKVKYEIQIPENTTATVILPMEYVSDSDKEKYPNYRISQNQLYFELGSGKYYFGN